MRKGLLRAWLPGFCRASSIALLFLVIGMCLPITIPRLFGFAVHDMVSGSMDPAIPVGSVIYVKSCNLPSVGEGDIIVYTDADGVVAHRVVANRSSLGEFVTKGDANEEADHDPVPYERVTGRVVFHLPALGMAIVLWDSTMGKTYLFMLAGCGVMLWLLADRLEPLDGEAGEESAELVANEGE